MHETDEVARGMRAQLEAWRESLQGGDRRLGWKIGINDPGVQKHLGISRPVVGWMTTRTLLEDGGRYVIAAGSTCMVEAEVALRLGRDVEPGTSARDAGHAIEALAPAIEIVDFSRSKDGIGEILAHDIFHAAVAFGPWRSPALEFEPSALRPVVLRNGEPARSGEPGLAPEDYGGVLALVAERLADAGHRLRKDDRVISGSYNQPLPVAAGDAVTVDFGPLGTVSIGFT